MQCAACGASFQGNFCPQCGAAAPARATAPNVVCYRCGTAFSGNFCPRCGAPAGAWAPPVPYIPPPPPGGAARSFLSVVWALSLVLFFVLLASNFVTLVAFSPTIFDGIRDVRTGSTVNAGFDAGDANWTFQAASGGIGGSWIASGGDPGGFLRSQFDAAPSTTVSAFWIQPFNTFGSAPYRASLFLDYRVVQSGGGRVTLRAFLDRNAGPPVPGSEQYAIPQMAIAGWIPAEAPDPTTGDPTNRIDLGGAARDVGMYFLKVSLAVTFDTTATGPAVVDLDNLQVRWGSNAALVLFVIVPYPTVVLQTRDPVPFTLDYALVAAGLVAALALQLTLDARPLARVLHLPLRDLGPRLRARVGTIATFQTFLAVYFFQVMFILVLNALGVSTPSPIIPGEYAPWYLLYQLANASVYEEVITRVMIIGVPLFAASFAMRARWIAKRPETPGAHRGRYLLGSLRYLYGGTMNRDSPMSSLVAGGVLLAISSAIFGLAHAPGYGDWKVLPAALAGLALGYLYLRHGLAAAILFHFATNYFFAIVLATPDAGSWGALLEWLLFGVLLVGGGFLAYYIWYSGKLIGHILNRSRWPGGVPAIAAPPGPVSAPAPPAPPPQVVRAGPVVIPPGYTPRVRPPPYGVAPVQFRCARCGWIEARFQDGRFVCLRCGSVA